MTSGALHSPLNTATSLDRWVLLFVGVGYAALLLPSAWDLKLGIWSGASGGHEALVLAVAAWLIYRRRHQTLALPAPTDVRTGIVAFALCLLIYLFARTQQILRLELLSLIGVAAAVLVIFKGWAGCRLNMFALGFLLFAVPMPYTLELSLTAPLMKAVSVSTTHMLSWLGYPVGRSGVIITLGQYQLLVAEACGGLHSMLFLEAMGLLYGHLMNYTSWARQAAMAVLVVPLAFIANVIRVVVLALLTYHFGDAVGQGYLHPFAGLMLFGMTLAMLAGVDWLLRRPIFVWRGQ